MFMGELNLESMAFCVACSRVLREGEEVVLANDHIEEAYHQGCYGTAKDVMFSSSAIVHYET